MDKLSNYRNIIKQTLKRHADQTASVGQIETSALFDEHSDNYMVVDMGWDRTGRVHAVVIHVRLHNGKVWVEVDGTENGITEELLDAGIVKTDIVLGFYRPERRELTEYAAA